MRINSGSRRCRATKGLRCFVFAITAGSALTFGGRLQATSIGIDLGPAGKLKSRFGVSFDALNGIHLSGQTLSLDFFFTNAKFVRLFTVTNQSFTVVTTLYTMGSGASDFVTGTGDIFDRNGTALETPQELGSASENNAMSVGLSPLFSEQLHKPLDFFGVHLELTLPTDSSIEITGGRFQLLAGRAGHEDVFGIGPGVPRDIVPESGDTLLFLVLGAIGLLGAKGSLAHCRASRKDLAIYPQGG